MKSFRVFQVALGLFFAGILLHGIFVRPHYDPNDFPYFGTHPWTTYALFTGIACLVWFLSKAQTKPNLRLALGFQFLLQLVFVVLFPLYPHSDMKQVYDISQDLNFVGAHLEYLSRYPNQLATVFMLALWSKIMPEGLVFLKLLNILSSIAVTYFGYKLFVLLFKKESLAALLLFLFFPAALLYANHIYNDLPFTALATGLTYLVLRNKAHWLWGLIAASGYLLRPTMVLFLVPLLLFSFKVNKKASILLFGTFLAIILGYRTLAPRFSGVDLSGGYPVWSWIYMGFNDQKFGFQDGSHSLTTSAYDVTQRIKDLGIMGVGYLLYRKTIWLWLEGTYQADRYGFGNSAFYQSDAPWVRYMRSPNSLRELITTSMFCLYFVLMIGFVWFLLHEKATSSELVLVGIQFMFLLFYIVWEIKSRYLFPLYPLLIILGMRGIDLATLRKRIS